MSARQRSCKCPECGRRYRRVEQDCECQMMTTIGFDAKSNFGVDWPNLKKQHQPTCARFGLCSHPACRARLVEIENPDKAAKPKNGWKESGKRNNPLGKTERGR